MKSKQDLIYSLYKVLKKYITNLETVFNILHIFQEEGSDSLLLDLKKNYENNQEAFIEYLARVDTSDDLLVAYYRPNNEPSLNSFIISNLKSLKIKQYFLNQSNNRTTYLSRVDKIFSQDPVDLTEGLCISGDIFTRSQEILREVTYQHSFIFLWKHFVYLFQDQIDHKNLAVWISTFNLLKNQEEIKLEEFLETDPINPFRNLVETDQDKVNIQNLLAFLYSFWPLVLLCPDQFYSYTTKALAPHVKGLNTIETLSVISLIRQTDIEELLNNPSLCLKGKGDFSYESSHFHQIFLNLSEGEKRRAGRLIQDFIAQYTQKALPLVLKYKTPHAWRSYAGGLSFVQNQNLVCASLVENSFSYKLLQEDFWQSFEEILNFQPFESLKGLSEEHLGLFPSIMSRHIAQGKGIWGNSWFGFYVISSSLPDSASFQVFLRYFKTLSPQVQSHKLIYYMSSVMLPDYNHFLFVYRVLAFMNVANNAENVLGLIQDPKEKEIILRLSKQSTQVDWLNSSIVIHSLIERPTLLEHLINKVEKFAFSDLEYFDPYSPVVLWLFFKSHKAIENTTLIHPQRSGFFQYLLYWKSLEEPTESNIPLNHNIDKVENP